MVWIFCPGHAGVRGNEKADELAGQAALGDNRKSDPATVIAMVEQWFDDNREVIPSHTMDRLRKRGKEELRRAPRRIFNQELTGTISRKTLGVLLERRASHMRTCTECKDVDSQDK